MNYKIRITKENQAIVKRIANENGMNEANLDFDGTGQNYIIEVGIFPLYCLNGSYQELTTEQFIEMFDKNETLENAAANESEYLSDWEDKDMYQKGFIEGAEWKAKRSYSEEDIREAIDFMPYHLEYGNIVARKSDKDIENFIEQFKKK